MTASLDNQGALKKLLRSPSPATVQALCLSDHLLHNHQGNCLRPPSHVIPAAASLWLRGRQDQGPGHKPGPRKRGAAALVRPCSRLVPEPHTPCEAECGEMFPQPACLRLPFTSSITYIRKFTFNKSVTESRGAQMFPLCSIFFALKRQNNIRK